MAIGGNSGLNEPRMLLKVVATISIQNLVTRLGRTTKHLAIDDQHFGLDNQSSFQVFALKTYAPMLVSEVRIAGDDSVSSLFQFELGLA